NAVHGDGERRMGLTAQRAKGHRARCEALHDILGGLDIIDGNRLPADLFRRLDAEEAAWRHEMLALIVYELGELTVSFVRLSTHGMLQLGDRFRRPDMLFATDAVEIVAANIERAREHRALAESRGMAREGFGGDLIEAHTFDLA